MSSQVSPSSIQAWRIGWLPAMKRIRYLRGRAPDAFPSQLEGELEPLNRCDSRGPPGAHARCPRRTHPSLLQARPRRSASCRSRCVARALAVHAARARRGSRPVRSQPRHPCATLTHMQRIGVRQLQQNASKVVRRVRRGERLEVTDRGRPVAILAPIHSNDPLNALEASGRLTRAEGDLLDLPLPIRLPPGTERPSRRLTRLRTEER
jgi:prevent-host-death family protein